MNLDAHILSSDNLKDYIFIIRYISIRNSNVNKVIHVIILFIYQFTSWILDISVESI